MGLQPLTSSLNPLDLNNVKTHLRIVNDVSANVSSDDAALAVYLQSAFEFVETETRQQLCTRDYLLTLDAFPCKSNEAIKLPKPPLQSVASIQYTDAGGNPQTFDPSAYVVDATQMPGRIVVKPGRSWPHSDGSANSVRITFTAGYSQNSDEIPMILQQAILLLTGHFYENREAATDRRIDSIPIGLQSIITQNTYPEAVG